jgi:hypothetical protein
MATSSWTNLSKTHALLYGCIFVLFNNGLYGKINNCLILVSQWKVHAKISRHAEPWCCWARGRRVWPRCSDAPQTTSGHRRHDCTLEWHCSGGYTPSPLSPPFKFNSHIALAMASLATPQATSSIYPRGVLARASLIVCRSFLATLRERKTQRVERWPRGCPVCMSHLSESKIQQTQQHNVQIGLTSHRSSCNRLLLLPTRHPRSRTLCRSSSGASGRRPIRMTRETSRAPMAKRASGSTTGVTLAVTSVTVHRASGIPPPPPHTHTHTHAHS